MTECPACAGNGFVTAAGNAPVGGEPALHCRTCGGRGQIAGVAGSSVAGGGFSAALSIMALLFVFVAVPVAAVVIMASWWPAAPLRAALEAVTPPHVVLREDPGVAPSEAWLGTQGEPLVVLAGLAVATVVALVALGVVLRRAARADVAGSGTRLAVWAWGIVWAWVVLAAFSLALPLWGIARGADLVPGSVENQTHYVEWWQIGGIIALGAALAWLRTGWALNRAARRAARAHAQR